MLLPDNIFKEYVDDHYQLEKHKQLDEQLVKQVEIPEPQMNVTSYILTGLGGFILGMLAYSYIEKR